MIEAEFLIESLGTSAFAVEESLKDLVDKIEEEDGIELLSHKIEEAKKEGRVYSAVLEMELKFDSIDSYILGVIKYPPSALMLSHPEEIKVKKEEFQEYVALAGRIIAKLYSKYRAGFIFAPPEEELIPMEEDEIEEMLDEGAIRVGILLKKGNEELDEIVNRIISTTEGDVGYIKAEEMELDIGSSVAVDLLIFPPSALFELVAKHLPVVIKIVEPDEITLTMLDLQDIGITLAGIVNEIMLQKAGG